MQFPYLSLILYCSLLIACHSAAPCFPHEETITPELMPLHGMGCNMRIKVNPPFFILQKMQSQASDAPTFINDSFYVADAFSPSRLDPNMVNYYANPNMKRVYVNDSRIVFCYGYKKQIDFMDFNSNLITSVKFKHANIIHNPKNQTDVNLSYICSYLGKHYFYTLFLGIPRDKHESHSSQNTFLEVYDLNGEPVIRYHLKGRYPVYFAVDENTFTLYGSEVYDNPEDHLLVYQLKGISLERSFSGM